MRALAVAALIFAACGGEEDGGLNFVPVESRWQVVGDAVECRGTVDEQATPTRHVCTWERVTVDGVETCSATLIFERADTSAPWTLVATFSTDATQCT